MHFGLTEEQTLLQHTVRDLAAGEFPPNRLRELFDAGTGFDADLWGRTAEMGLTGLIIPEAHGGAGLELLDLALVAEVIGEAALPGPFLGHALASLALARGGSDAQKARWLPALATGDVIGTVALGETNEAWEPESWQTEDHGGSLSGTKRYVEYGDRADLLIVGTAGGGLALLEGNHRGETDLVDGLDRTRSVTHLSLENAPAETLPGGKDAAPLVCDAGRILLAADAFGAAWKLIRLTVEYALEREQFGTKIAQFQSVKHQLANLASDCEPMRGLFWHAAHAFDHMPEARAREAATAKSHITDTAVRVGRRAVELHGGIGFTWECDVQFWVKRTMFDRTWLGSPRSDRERIAQMLGW
jgi:alkylation response protein AidB-like acyl-CoA dehydrogenase